MLPVRIVAAAAILLTSVSLAEEVSQQALDRAKQEMTKAVDEGKVAGIVHLVWHRGKVVHLETAGVADVDDGTPFTKNTIVRIYSMTKPITSVAAMTLFEQGKFELDDPVAKYIPAFEETKVFDFQDSDTRIKPAKR
ncbi:MAG: beta-lactamase family protein, partial [Pirellulales bacterium]|nr:beta-lactamase family protein [Pirellulales bacterium]